MRTVLTSRFAPDWRALAILFLGAALTALALRPGTPGAAAGQVSPAAAGELSPAAAGTRWVSCSGLAFLPHTASASYATFGTVRVFDTVSFCPISLPHGAVITAVRFHVYDNHSPGSLGPCHLKRTPLDPTSFLSPQNVAGPLQTGADATPGYAVLVDTTIPVKRATVDNRSFTYAADCNVSHYSQHLGVVGVSVRYTTGS